MGESSGKASLAVDGDPHVDDIADVFEEVIEFPVAHVEGQVADIEGLGRWFGPHVGSEVRGGVLNNDATSLEDLRVHSFNSAGGSLSRVVRDVSKSNVGDDD